MPAARDRWPTAVAVFDVDRTLLDGAAGYMFFQWLRKNGRVTARGWLDIAASVAAYRTRLRPETAIVRVGATSLAGLPMERVDEWADACVAESIAPHIFAEAEKTIRRHRKMRHFTMLASGSCQPIVEAIARHVGAHAGVGTRALVDSATGRYTGRAELPLCYHEGKAEWVRRRAEREGVSMDECHVYTDNGMDRPLLEMATHPNAVNPDGLLLPLAKERGWPVHAWSTLADPDRSRTGSFGPLRADAK
ncbi:MAG: HAD-IB family hydrolase [Deltaproteobacteria bacterium]|nr:HAD-IB family hydrolase [Deltaproteobacteria bacterium]